MQKKHIVTVDRLLITPVGCQASVVINSTGMVHTDILRHGKRKRLPNEKRVSSDCGALYSSPQGLRRRITISLPTEQATEDRFFEEFDYLIGLAKLKGEL